MPVTLMQAKPPERVAARPRAIRDRRFEALFMQSFIEMRARCAEGRRGLR